MSTTEKEDDNFWGGGPPYSLFLLEGLNCLLFYTEPQTTQGGIHAIQPWVLHNKIFIVGTYGQADVKFSGFWLLGGTNNCSFLKMRTRLIYSHQSRHPNHNLISTFIC